MGAAERVNRRRVLTAATEAVDKTNTLVGRYNECVRALKEQQERIDSLDNERKLLAAELTGRLDAQGKWLDVVDKEIATGLKEQRDRTERRLLELPSSLIERTPSTNTFFGRLVWLFTGL